MSIGLSVCLITKNEEKYLEDCLKSVQGISDEIIVVDTGSTDNTISIANKYNCKVYSIEWENDFSKARNYALSKANYPYILSIDADERILNPNVIYDVLKLPNSSTGGWLVKVISEARRTDGSTDTYISTLLRLFRNEKDIKFYGIIHEQIIDSLIKLNYKIQNTPLEFVHLGYTHSQDEMKKKQLRNLELLNIVIKNNPYDGYIIYQRAKTQLALHNLDEAEQDIHRALSKLGIDSSSLPQALDFGAVIAFQRGDNRTAILRAMDSLKIIPEQAFAYYILAEIFYSQKNYKEAIDNYTKLETIKDNISLNAQIAGDYHLPYEQLAFKKGTCLLYLRKRDEAYKEFNNGLNFNPNDIPCIVGMANIEYDKKNYEEARNLLEKALNIEPKRIDLLNYLNQIDRAIVEQHIFIENSTSNLDIFSNNSNINLNRNGSKPLITLSMIVKDESEYLAGCLDSVKNVVDEIVIVDTGSSDNTPNIALSYGAKVYEYEWQNDFASARNEALKHSTGEWILYLDADERLMPQSALYIRKYVSNTDESVGGFICTIESPHFQLTGTTELHRGGYPRLFRNYGYPIIKFVGRVHEQITPSIVELNKTFAFSDIIIHHSGYNQSIEAMDAKVRRNYKMLLEHIHEEPLNSYAWYQLGQTLAQMNLNNEAENAIRFSIDVGTLSDSVYASATASLAQLVGNKKKFTESLYWAERSLEKAPDQVYALNLKAFSLLYLDRPAEAEKLFLEIKRRQVEKKYVPRSGFDIVIPDSTIDEGLRLVKKAMEGKVSI